MPLTLECALNERERNGQIQSQLLGEGAVGAPPLVVVKIGKGEGYPSEACQVVLEGMGH